MIGKEFSMKFCVPNLMRLYRSSGPVAQQDRAGLS
jgi:hypothetical protein